MNQESTVVNPLSTEPIGRLLMKFAVPSIISMLVGAFYNIVDQIFIGQGVGILGNAATNVAFPITTITTAAALLLGIGGAANFNLALGAKQKDRARRIAGTAFGSLLLFGVLMLVVIRCFLRPIVLVCGATDQILEYSLEYVSITSLGIPFYMVSTGGAHLVRADGSPTYSMAATLSGALLNIFLDYLFVFPMDMGLPGAALATVIGQVVSALLILSYLFRFKSVPLSRRDFLPKPDCLVSILALGAASCVNQLAITVVQIVMNNVLKYYGSMSVYGSDIPLAVAGIVAKVNMLFLSVVIGISQGAQPIIGFNYGAKQYLRVRRAYFCAARAATIVAVAGFLCFQIFPHQIVSIFGSGDELYFQFAEAYFRIYMFCTFFNGLQPVTANFFTSIGKATRGIWLSMTRQILFLVPLILLFPIFFGIDGVMYAAPIADGAAGILAIVMIFWEFRRMPKDAPV